MNNLRIKEWDKSYEKGDNYVWYPHEEIIRFVSKYFKKKVDLDKFKKIHKNDNLKALDFGCGIGRHVIFFDEMEIDCYGVDISKNAINKAIEWVIKLGKERLKDKFILGDGISQLPFEENYFDFVVSHGVFDSMSFDIAKSNLLEVSRVLKENGLVYLDLISGDDNKHGREYSGEEVVETEHEKGTIQSYFNFSKIEKLIQDSQLIIEEINLIKRENILNSNTNSRYHIILRKVKD